MSEKQLQNQIAKLEARIRDLESNRHKPARLAPPAGGASAQLPDLQYQFMGLFEVADHVLGGDFMRACPPLI